MRLYQYHELTPAQQAQAAEFVEQPHLFVYRLDDCEEVERAYYLEAVVRLQPKFFKTVKGRKA